MYSENVVSEGGPSLISSNIILSGLFKAGTISLVGK